MKYIALKGTKKPEFDAFVETLKKAENTSVIERAEELFMAKTEEVVKESK